MERPEDKVRKVLKIAKEPISMETPIGDEEDSHLGDFIEDKNAVLVGSRPISCSICRPVRTSLLMVSIMCTGIRIVRAWSAIDRVIA